MEIRKRHYQEQEGQEPARRFIVLRQWLNAIFMLGALIGVVTYFYYSQQIGTYVILTSMVFKIVECVFRLIK